MKENLKPSPWPILTLAILAALTVAAATESGLENASSRSLASQSPAVVQRHVAPFSSRGSPVPSGPPPKSGSPPPPERTTPATEAVGCPTRWSWDQAPGTPVLPASLKEMLVPTGPSFAVVCRYAGLNQSVPPGRLERSRILDGSALDGLVTYVDSTQRQRTVRGTINCPMSEGSVDGVIFRYADAREVPLTVALDGCEFVSNGETTVFGWGVGQRLAAWVGADSPVVR